MITISAKDGGKETDLEKDTKKKCTCNIYLLNVFIEKVLEQTRRNVNIC